MVDDHSSENQITQRSNFSVQHIMAAARFSRECYLVEKKHMGEQLGIFHNEIISFTIGAIFLSVAALEANANEIFADALDNFISLGSYDHSFLSNVWELSKEKLSILEKYALLLSMKGIENFGRNVKTYQNISLLIKSRNALVHFKPEWQHKQIEHKKIGLNLKGKFLLSPFIVDKNAPIFPTRCMTFGFAEWAVLSSIKFVKDCSIKMDILYRYESYLSYLHARPQE